MGKRYKIGIFRALHLGDLLLAVPAFRSIRAGFPDAEITLIGLPWAIDFVRAFGTYFDRFVEFPGCRGISETRFDEQRTAEFLAAQKAYGYDLVIQMHGSGVASNPFALTLGGARTVGYFEGARPSGLTLGIPYRDDQPEILRNLELALLLACPDTGLHLEFPVSQDDRKDAARLLVDARRPLIGLHPGSKRPAQRWDPASFAAVADVLTEAHSSGIVLTGSPGEAATVADVERRMRAEPISLVGKTSLFTLASLLETLDLFITNDTGPGHLAEAVGTPTIRVFGPGDYSRWAPLNETLHIALRRQVPCSPCYFSDCPIDHRCLAEISPVAVTGYAHQLLAREGAAA